MPSSALDVYSLRAPPWRARLNALAPRLGWPDLFPAVAGASPEMAITPASARSGYTAKPATKNEGFSAHDLIYDRLSTAQHLVGPLLAEIATRQAELARTSALPPRPAQRPALPRVTLNEAKLQAYLRDLADPAVPLARLARSVPHGIRGERLIEMLYLARPPPAQDNEPKAAPPAAAPSTPDLGPPVAAGTPTPTSTSSLPAPVPIARAAWFLHTVGAIDLQSARAKPPPVALDLTQALSVTLKRLIDAVPSPNDGASLLSTASAHTAAASPSEPLPSASAPHSFATPQWTHRLSYFLTLSRVMGDLGLLHPPTWLRLSTEMLGLAHAGQIAFVLPLLQDGVALFPTGRTPLPLARMALAALARAHATLANSLASLEGEGRALAISLRRQTTSLARALVLSSPRVLVGPRLWAAHGAILPSVLGIGEHGRAHAHLRASIQRAHKRVNRLALLQYALRSPPTHSAFDTAVSLNNLLDALDPSCDLGAAFVLIFGLASTPAKTQRRVDDLLLWACTPSHFPCDEARDWPAGSSSAAARIGLVTCWLVYLHGCGGDVPQWFKARQSVGELSKEEHTSLLAQAIPVPDAAEDDSSRPKAKPFSLDAFLPIWLQDVQQAHQSPPEGAPLQPSDISLPLPRPTPRPSLSSQARSAVEFASLAALVESLLAQEIVRFATLLRAAAPAFLTGQASLTSRVVRSVALPPGNDTDLRRRTIYPHRARDRETWEEAMVRRATREVEAVFPFIRGDSQGDDSTPPANLKEQVQASMPHLWNSTPYVQRMVLAPVVSALTSTMSELRPYTPSLRSGELQRVLFVLHQAGDWDALAQALLMILHDLAAQDTAQYTAALPFVETYVVSHALLWTARGELMTMVSSLAQCARCPTGHQRATIHWARTVLLSLMRAGSVTAQEAVQEMREPLPLDSVMGDGSARRVAFDEARSEALSSLQAGSHCPHVLAQTLQSLQGNAEPTAAAAVQVSIQLHISLEGPDHAATPKSATEGLDELDRTILGLVHDTAVDVDAALAAALESAPTSALLRALPALTPIVLGLLKDLAVGMDTLVSLIVLPGVQAVESLGSDQLLRFLHDLATAGGKMSLPLGKEAFRALGKVASKDPNPLPVLLALVNLAHSPHQPIFWGELRDQQLWREGIRAVTTGHGSVHPPPLLAGGPIADLITPWSFSMALERISALPVSPLAASSPLTGLPSRRTDESEESALATILVERLFSPTSTRAGEQALALSPSSLSNRVHTHLLAALVRAVEIITDPSHADEQDLALAEAALAQLVRARHVLGLKMLMPSDVPYWSALIHGVLKLLATGENTGNKEDATTLAIDCIWLLCQPNEWWTASPAVRGIIPRLYQRVARVLIACASRAETSMVALCLDSLLAMLEDVPASLLALCQQGVSLASPTGHGRDLAWLESLPPALALDVVRVLILPPHGEKVVLAPSFSAAVSEACFTPVEIKAWELVPSLRSAEESAASSGTEAYTTTYDPLGPIPDQGALSLASFAARKERDGPRLHILAHPRPIAPHDDSMISRSIEAERSYGTYASDPPELRAARMQAPTLLRYQSRVEEAARIIETPPPFSEEEKYHSPVWCESEADLSSPLSSELSQSEPEPEPEPESEESPPVSPARSMLLKHKPALAATSPLAQSPRSPLPSPRKGSASSIPVSVPKEANPPVRKRPRPRPARPKNPPTAPLDSRASTPTTAPAPAGTPQVASQLPAPHVANPNPDPGRGPVVASAPGSLTAKKRKAPPSGTPLVPPAQSKRKHSSVQLISPHSVPTAASVAAIPTLATGTARPLTHTPTSVPAPTPFPGSVPVSAPAAAPPPPMSNASQPWAPPASYAALFPDPSSLLGVSALPPQPIQPPVPLAKPAAVVGTVPPSLDPRPGVTSATESTKSNTRPRARATPRSAARGTAKRPARGRGKIQTSDVYPDAAVPTLPSAAQAGDGGGSLPQFAAVMPSMEWQQDPLHLQRNVHSVPQVSNVPSVPGGPHVANMSSVPNLAAAPSLRASPIHAGSLTVPLQQSVDSRLSPVSVTQPQAATIPQNHQAVMPSQSGVPSQGVDPLLPSGSSGSEPFFGTPFLNPGGMDLPPGQGLDTWFSGMFGYNGAL